MERERINPVRINDKTTGIGYELDFNRDSVRFAENRGFKVNEVLDFPVTKIPEFFFYAFRMHHKNVARDKTDALLDKLGGLSGKMLDRLIQLYNQAVLSHVVVDDEELEKNENVTVEL